MSKANDILFAPIHRKADFLVRMNVNSFAFDWKPISARAGNWAHRHYPSSYSRSLNFEGWMKNFSNESRLDALVKNFPPADWLEELVDGDYIFEVANEQNG